MEAQPLTLTLSPQAGRGDVGIAGRSSRKCGERRGQSVNSGGEVIPSAASVAERELTLGSGPRLGGYEVTVRDRRHAPAQKENAARGAALAVPAVPGKPT